MGTLIKDSGIQSINKIRKDLWESIYSNFNNLNSLATHIRERFGTGTITNLDFNFQEMTISIETDRPLSNIEINATMTMAYKDFIEDMYMNNKSVINKENYNLCMKHSDMLFLLTFKSKNTAVIHL